MFLVPPRDSAKAAQNVLDGMNRETSDLDCRPCRFRIIGYTGHVSRPRGEAAHVIRFVELRGAGRPARVACGAIRCPRSRYLLLSSFESG